MARDIEIKKINRPKRFSSVRGMMEVKLRYKLWKDVTQSVAYPLRGIALVPLRRAIPPHSWTSPHSLGGTDQEN